MWLSGQHAGLGVMIANLYPGIVLIDPAAPNGLADIALQPVPLVADRRSEAWLRVFSCGIPLHSLTSSRCVSGRPLLIGEHAAEPKRGISPHLAILS